MFNDKPVSEMTTEEILAQITEIRERRAVARERRAVSTKVTKKGGEESTKASMDILDILMNSSKGEGDASGT